jgi:hypothetical protein
MDIHSFYKDVRAKEAELEKNYPDRVVHITSLENKEKNVTSGATCSSTPRMAAERIVNGTHRIATQDEIDGFLRLQAVNRDNTLRAEIQKRNQIVTVLPGEAFPAALTADPQLAEAAGTGGKRARS